MQETKDTTDQFEVAGEAPEDFLKAGDVVDFKGIEGICDPLKDVVIKSVNSHMVNQYLIEHPQGFTKKQFVDKIAEKGIEDGFENFHSSELEDGKQYVIALPSDVIAKTRKNNENTKKMKFSVLHVPTRDLQKFETQEEAKNAILKNEKSLPASEFMMLRETLRDLIIIRLAELKKESEGETKFSPFFVTLIDATYKHFTSRDQHDEDGYIRRETLTQLAKELHQINLIYTDELKYEKLNIEELAQNIDNWIEAVDDLDAQARMTKFLKFIQEKHSKDQIKEVGKHLDHMMETQQMTKDETTHNILSFYNEIIWDIPHVAKNVSESLEVKYEDSTLVLHVQAWIHKILTL